MTPSEKAKELVDKFSKEIGLSDLNVLPSMYFSLDEETKTLAKQCALIYVNGIISVLESDGIYIMDYREIIDVEYWKQVKSEIEKL